MAKRALRSALSQTFKDYEVIVIDDAGTDDTEKLVGVYMKTHKNLKYYKSPINKGLSWARNYGVSISKGEYVVCLDDDNELMPKFLERTIQKMEAMCKAWRPDEIGGVSVGRIIKYKDFEDYAQPYIGDTFTAVDWGWLLRREVFNEIKYDEDMRANEDTDFGLRFFKRFRWGALHEKLTIAFDADDPKESLSFPSKRELDGMTYFLKKNLHEYKDADELRCLYRLCGRKFYRGGFRLKGIGFFLKSFMAHKNLNSLANLFFIIFGWGIYNNFMTLTEKVGAKRRRP